MSAIIVAYSAIAVVIARAIAGHLAWRMLKTDKDRRPTTLRWQTEPSGEQWLGASAAGVVLGAIWPLVVIAMISPLRIGEERRELDRQKIEEQHQKIGELEQLLEER